MPKTTRSFILLLCLLIHSSIFAQKSLVSGKITDDKTGAALDGVTVRIKSSGVGTSTDYSGMFSINANANDELEVSEVGYAAQSIKINGRSQIEVSLVTLVSGMTEIVLVGTRSAGRIKTETPVPIDVININQAGNSTAKMDLTSALNYAAPSFNYNKQSGADGADHVDLGTLRGLGPDQTLVLINGKRRHQTAFVALFGTRGRGNSGADLNSFPEAAVDRIEILRDGASAQYGSDAMAGVINIVLKKDINHWTINTGWSGYYDHEYNSLNNIDPSQYYTGNKIDGNTFTFSANNGFAIGKNGGFINLSVDFLTQGKTFRQVPDTNAYTNSKALPYTNSGRRAFGDGSVTTGGAMYNMELPTSSSGKVTFYSFGGYNYKASDAYAYTRNFSAKPERFPVDANGNLLFVPGIMRVSSDGETFYNPHIQTHITDMSLAAGIKGETNSNWYWDLSNTIGRNDFHYFGDKTFNASNIGKTTPNHFDDGGFNFLQNTVNLDFSKPFTSIAEGLNLGLGAEFRYEKYGIYKGDFGSYGSYETDAIVYPNLIDGSGDSLRTPAAGSQGFPGFSPSDEVDAHRTNFGAYVDAELNVTKAWLVDGAVRIENYSDFGFVSTYKFATRYKLAPGFNLRGSISTGYRAPSLQQINFSNTLTSFSGGILVQSRIANNNDPITKAAGIPELKQETSINGSLGFSWKPIPELTVTIDGYAVRVKNRIVLSGLFSADDNTLPAGFTSQLNAINVGTAQFFANAVNTTNTGVDVVIDYNKRWGNKGFKALLAGNVQQMTIDEIHVPSLLNDTKLHRKTFFSDREEAFLKASAPKEKFTLNLEYDVNKFGIGTHVTYFGKIVLLGFGDATPDNPNQTGINPMVPSDANPDIYVPEVFNFNGKVTTDIFASYKFSKKVNLFIGTDNLFNVHPNLGVNPLARGWFGDNESGGPWDSVQMGFNGLHLFSKLVFNF